MRRWADRRAARRARRKTQYMGEYFQESNQHSGYAANPYQVPSPRNDRGASTGVSTAGHHDDPATSPGPGPSTQVTTSTGPAPAIRHDSGATGHDSSTPPAHRSGRSTPQSPPRRERSSRRGGWLIGGLVTAGLIIAGIVGATTGLFARGTTIADPVDEQFQATWRYEARELDPDATGLPQLATVDSRRWNASQDKVIVTPGAWVVVNEHADARAVVGLDPQTGSVLWESELDRAQCSLEPGPDDTVVCLASADGQEWTGHVLRADTGAEVTTFSTSITGVWGLRMTGAGLAVLAESTPLSFDRLTLLDPSDGTEQWTVDLLADDDTAHLVGSYDLDGTEHAYIANPHWGDLGSSFTITSAGRSVVVDAAAGEVSALDCYPVVITAETIACNSFQGETIMYDGEGEQVWASPHVQLARPGYTGEHILANIADGSLWQTDWDTGTVGTELGSTERDPRITGTADHPFVMHERELLAVGPSEIRWHARVRGMSSVTTVIVADDVAIVHGVSALGLDLATGEELWVRQQRGDLHAIDDRLVGISSDEIALLQVP